MADKGGGGGGGYSGAASVSTSASQGLQQNFSHQFGGNDNSTGFQLPKWAIPVVIVMGFGALIVWLITRKT
jgi:hypothetical protein